MPTALLTALALCCFAGNSLFARLALGPEPGAAASFTAIRLASGALVLGALALRRPRSRGWVAPAALLAYALPFSLAYVRLPAGTGALVLFGAVQITLLSVGFARGERLRPAGWLGYFLAAGGLIALNLPGTQKPDLAGAALMALAGAAWGAYTLAGKSAADPIASNARSFLWSAIPAIAAAFAMREGMPSARTALLAAFSGAVTSGLGYAVWYRALRGLGALQAAGAQLSTPILTALAAIPLLDERMTLRLALSGAAVLGGVALATLSRPSAPKDGAR